MMRLEPSNLPLLVTILFLIHMSILRFLSKYYLNLSYRQIPLTWTHRITQYSPPEEDHTVYVDDPMCYDYTSFGKVFNVSFDESLLFRLCS